MKGTTDNESGIEDGSNKQFKKDISTSQDKIRKDTATCHEKINLK
jgi:hypothetical protein